MDQGEFLEAVEENPFNRVILRRLPQLRLPQTHLVAGCLFQTVWNRQVGREPGRAINDYDVFYWDDRDLSYEAEDRAVRAAGDLFADLPVRVEVRNQARVHLWFGRKFGRPCPALPSSRAAIDRFLVVGTCLGVAVDDRGELDVYAPHGFSDLLKGDLRPNPVNPDLELFRAKALSYQVRWPHLRIVESVDRAV